jgi:hypothetical protein
MKRRLKDLENISWSVFQLQERRQGPKEIVWCAQNTGKGGTLYIGEVNMKQE